MNSSQNLIIENATQSASMLLVTRDASSLAPLAAIGDAYGWAVETVGSGWEALDRVQSPASPHLVLLDLTDSGADGLRTLRWMRRVRPELPVVLLASAQDASQRAEALRLGAQDYLNLPFTDQSLQSMIGRYFTASHAKLPIEPASENIEQVDEDTFLIAASPAMRQLRVQLELLAQIDEPVLIYGEPATGKEAAARLIHKLSVRSGFEFLKINCRALPGDLLENELFGQNRRVVSGVSRTTPGKLEHCGQGTVLFDEITDLPVSVQGRLMHLLQDKFFHRNGSDVKVAADMRVVAASHANLENALAQGKLLEDLYYRLSAFSVYLPPLRERQQDIPLLLGHLMSRLSRRYDLPARTFSPRLVQACELYAWPENLKELESFVKRYLVVGDEPLALSELQRKSEAAAMRQRGPRLELVPDPVPGDESAEPAGSSLKSLVQSVKGEAERNAIAAALGQTQWNRKAAARLLKVSYRTLLYKIQQYRLSPPADFFPQALSIPEIKTNGNGQ